MIGLYHRFSLKSYMVEAFFLSKKYGSAADCRAVFLSGKLPIHRSRARNVDATSRHLHCADLRGDDRAYYGY